MKLWFAFTSTLESSCFTFQEAWIKHLLFPFTDINHNNAKQDQKRCNYHLAKLVKKNKNKSRPKHLSFGMKLNFNCVIAKTPIPWSQRYAEHFRRTGCYRETAAHPFPMSSTIKLALQNIIQEFGGIKSIFSLLHKLSTNICFAISSLVASFNSIIWAPWETKLAYLQTSKACAHKTFLSISLKIEKKANT